MTINPSHEVDQRARDFLLKDLREEFEKALVPLMVGKQFPVDILYAMSGKVIYPANREVFDSLVEQIAYLPRQIEIESSPLAKTINVIIEQFTPLFYELDPIGDREIVLPDISNILNFGSPDMETSKIPVPQIDRSGRTSILCVIRKVFSSSSGSQPCYCINDLARALYRSERSGIRIKEVLRQDLLTAVAHSIIKGQGGKLMIVAKDITGYEEEILAEALIDAIGYEWKEPDEAVRLFARWLGFARTTLAIQETAHSLIADLIRKGRLEQSDTRIRRAT